MNTTSTSFIWNVVGSFQNLVGYVWYALTPESMIRRQEAELNGEPTPFVKWLGIDVKISEMIGWPTIVENFMKALYLTYQALMGIMALIIIWFCLYTLKIILPPVYWFLASIFSGLRFLGSLFSPRYSRYSRKSIYH